ncbi:MAG: PilZ domain-containing protein [Pseudobutyrivibrio ruminis]|uniref:PilZ domain-containing protein n=1 Tax=Pseudobutyrivibrio ruminis TaxID=46206 RepID=UPI0026EBAEE5|nr:PilZ domain-containing protein [Pseudobutyrivibrio ruminis]MBE5913984.1 PilZ domain-containing protein [Pseudobutyrivibrio ruminis]
MEEKRKNKRLDIDVKVEIERIDEANITTVKYMEVEVTNISKTGLAFRVKDVEFEEGACFDARIQIWTKETIDTVFKVVRVNKLEDGMYEYGCIFVGMTDTDALKIEIYQLFNNAE